MSQGAGEKTEQPTQKRLRDSRKKGQVAKSQDLSSALLLLVAVGVLWLVGEQVAGFAFHSIKDQFVSAASFSGPISEKAVSEASLAGLMSFAMILAPLFLAVWVFAFLVNYLQVGSIFAPEVIKPKFSKLNPADGFKNKFLKLRPYAELTKTAIKMTVTAFVAGWVLWFAREDIILLSAKPIEVGISFAFRLVVEIGFKIGIVFLILGVVDFFLQGYLHRRDLKMTKHEVKEEFKETEGNPLIKSQRRALHRELLEQGLISGIRSADVVVANPTHIAVALKYDKSENGAPKIVAKGADLMAAQIRKLAREAAVPVTRDIPLARALFELEIEEEIPEELYEAVAVILRWVYSESKAQTVPGVSLGVANG
ncbi:MAG: EscU/YscU/HrcU family type III secretion system export apparatus switch protein [Pyrinomonadaceae bacterium]|nr:EscU/YscU/HrcU family type III secretion system export apparatus switch protein [Pyrinomonadaceae bacterium]